MPIYSFVLRVYDPEQPWILVSTSRESVELAEGEDFTAWALERYPSKTHRVELERDLFRWAT